MSFPNVIYGDYGDEKRAQSTKIGNLHLGTLMILPDGRKFRHARAASGTAMTAGYLYQTDCATTRTGLSGTMTAKSFSGSAAVGATTIVFLTSGSTAPTKDLYEDGYAIIANSTGTGIGRMYKIKGNGSAASNSASCTLELQPTDAVETAFSGTSLGIRFNEYSELIIATGNTVYTGPIAGVPPVAVSAGFYHWIQRSGPAACFAGGTVLIIGDQVMASTTQDGAMPSGVAAGTASAKVLDFIGQGMTISATNGFSLVNLRLE